jgi:L-alanine-DL-glutamate epimerase-like enolase superfamily enzyme
VRAIFLSSLSSLCFLFWLHARAELPCPRVPVAAFRIGPEKGVIHLATGAVDNALWDLYARARQKPLWKLLVDMSPVCVSSEFATI